MTVPMNDRVENRTRAPYERHLPIRTGFDLVVVGAGPAGCGAALAASAQGLSVLLLEAGTRAGGMGTAGMVSSFAPMSDGLRCVSGGYALRIVEILHERGALGPQVTPDYWNRALQRWIPFRPEELAHLYDRLLQEHGVTVRYGSRVVDVEPDDEDGVIRGVVVADVEGLHLVRAPVFIDASGDAVVATAAGFAVETAGRDTERIMPPTLCALLSNIEWDRIPMSPSGNCPNHQQPMLEKAIAAGRFTRSDRHLPGLYRIGEGQGMMNAGHLFNTDATDAVALSSAYGAGRDLVREYVDFYREYIPGCETMQLVTTAPLLGVRESRRIVGEYVLGYEDYVARRRFDDGIGLCAGKVDIHVYDDSPEEYERYYREFNEIDRLGEGESFAIPYRSLIPKGSRNLWVAGRCISSDVKVQGALRVQPTCMVMGEAAGVAVSLALEAPQGQVEAMKVDTEALRERLRENGAVLE